MNPEKKSERMPAPADFPERKRRQPADPPSILIVDDEESIRELLKTILGSEGYHCDTSATAEEALNKIEKDAYALVMIDIKMPGMDGIQLLERLQLLDLTGPPLATVVLTASAKLDMAVRAMKLGAYDYLTKPFSTEAVLMSVQRALDKRRLLIENLAHQRNLESRVKEQSEKIQSSFLKTIEALARTLEAKDSIAREHCRRVTEYSVKIACRLDLPPKEIENIRVASLLHDIGKLGISEKILEKSNPLLEEEVEHIHRHPLVAENILGPIDDLEEIIKLIKHHHERWDGTGYPDQLKGEAIPLGSRILSLADSYDAMVSSRPYRSALKQSEARNEIRKKSGIQFDPRVVEAFFQAIRE